VQPLHGSMAMHPPAHTPDHYEYLCDVYGMASSLMHVCLYLSGGVDDSII